MINKLIDAISVKLHQTFGDNYKYYSESIEQGFEEPCFFIKLITSTQGRKSQIRYLKGQKFDIHYFPSEVDKNLEMLDVIEKLNDVLEYVTDADVNIYAGSNISSEIVDEVLHFFVSFDAYVYKMPDAVDKMEDLTVDNALKG